MVSIIVPVYNAEAYLGACIESICNQSVKDIEVILIDDHSKDESLKICRQYAEQDNRVHYFSNLRRGVSSARNLGMKNAAGDYIIFVDSDDILDKDAVKDYLEFGKKYDLIGTGHFIINEQGTVEKEIRMVEQDLSQTQFITGLFSHQYGYLGYCWGKLFKHEILEKNSIYFNENFSYNEDRIFVLQYAMCCEKIYLLDKMLYYYRKQPESLMAKINTNEQQRQKNIENEIDTMEYMLATISEKINLEAAVTWGKYQFLKKAYIWRKCINKEDKINSKIDEIIKNYRKQVLKSHFIGVKDKLRLAKVKYLGE